MQIIIDSTKQTSEEDMEELRIIINNLKRKYHFDWHVNTYYKGPEEEIEEKMKRIASKAEVAK